MALIRSRNLLHETAPKTRLTNSEVAGTTVLRVENTTGLTTSWAVQIGEVGEEQTEVLIGTATNIGTITTPTSSFAHPEDTPIYFIKYDKVVFERSTTGTSGTATPIANGTVTYQANDYYTVFDDTTGSAGYGYREYYRSSVLAVNSNEGAWHTFAGFSFYSLGNIRQRVRDKLWNSDWLEDEKIDNWINEWKDELTNEAIQVNEDYALGTVDIAFDSTNGYGTVITADFNQPRRIWITYDGVNWYNSTKMNINDFLPDQVFSSVHPYHAWLGDTIFQVRPEESGGTARMVFYRVGTPMVNETDELPLYMRPFTKSFVDYGLIQAEYKDGKINLVNKKAAEQTLKDRFVASLAPRDKTGQTYVDIVEPIDGGGFY
jgi:hypothetical protein